MMGVNRWELPPSCCSPCKRWPRGVGGAGAAPVLQRELGTEVLKVDAGGSVEPGGSTGPQPLHSGCG